MARIGKLPATIKPCHCESPSLDRLGTLVLTNDATYRVRYCQQCGGGYDSSRAGAAVPPDAPIRGWHCYRCGAHNLDGFLRCTNCPVSDVDWRCRAPECGVMNPPDTNRCVRCMVLATTTLIVGP